MKIKLRISIFGILMLLILIFGDNSEYGIIALSAAVAHELGHIVASLCLKMKLDSFSLNILGAKFGVSMPLYSYKHELILALSGPLSNLVSGGTAAYIYTQISSQNPASEHILFFSVASFFLAFLNLLPIKGFDGGEIFICIAAPPLGIYTAERILAFTSFIFILILWIMSVYLMLKIGSSLALFVFSSALFAELFLNSDNFQN